MSKAILIDGSVEANKVYDELKLKIKEIENKNLKIPGLAIVLIGDDKASSVYVNMIVQKCDEIGIKATRYDYHMDVTTEDILSKIQELNEDCTVDGILVQFPLPKDCDEMAIRQAIKPEKDIDSAGSENMGKFYALADCFIPCTPKAMHRMLRNLGQDFTGKKAVIIGRSHVVGKPSADLALRENMTVTITHRYTEDLAEFTREADVIFAGAGVPHLIKADMVKEGAVILDAGINVKDGKLVGDCDYKNMLDKVSYVTPVPGGVGPMTIAMLIENVLEAYVEKCELDL